MTMEPKVISAAEFKAKCLALMDDVARTGQPIVVTKRGKAIIRIVPVDEPPSLRGSIVREEDLLAPIDEAWEADP